MAADEDVTLGEVNRNVAGIGRDLRDLQKEVTELKVTSGTQVDRTRRLEAIVYGALGTAVAGLITALLSILTRGTH